MEKRLSTKHSKYSMKGDFVEIVTRKDDEILALKKDKEWLKRKLEVCTCF